MGQQQDESERDQAQQATATSELRSSRMNFECIVTQLLVLLRVLRQHNKPREIVGAVRRIHDLLLHLGCDRDAAVLPRVDDTTSASVTLMEAFAEFQRLLCEETARALHVGAAEFRLHQMANELFRGLQQLDMLVTDNSTTTAAATAALTSGLFAAEATRTAQGGDAPSTASAPSTAKRKIATVVDTAAKEARRGLPTHSIAVTSSAIVAAAAAATVSATAAEQCQAEPLGAVESAPKRTLLTQTAAASSHSNVWRMDLPSSIPGPADGAEAEHWKSTCARLRDQNRRAPGFGFSQSQKERAKLAGEHASAHSYCDGAYEYRYRPKINVYELVNDLPHTCRQERRR